MDLFSFAALAGVTFFAATVQAATGFGFALLAVPFFLLVMGSLEAIQVTAVINFVISVVLIRGLLKQVPRALLLHLVAGSLAGFPVGLAAYRAANLAGIQLTIGVLITLFAAILILREWRVASGAQPADSGAATEFRSNPLLEIPVGFLSGVMGVALAMPGPVVVLYLVARKAGKNISRPATLLLFLFSYGAISLVHATWGGMTGDAWVLAAKLTPFVIAGAIFGHLTSRYLNDDNFRSVVLTILLASGCYAVWAAL